METIELKDKVLSHEQFESLQYAINGLFEGGHYHPDQIKKFHITPILMGPRYGHYTGIVLEVDDDFAPALRAVLQAFGFIERPQNSLRPLSDNKEIARMVKSYASRMKGDSNQKIDWIVWYDLADARDIWLLFIARDVPVNENGDLDTYQMVPDSDLRIPGKLRLTLTSIEELELAHLKNSTQKAVVSLMKGDFLVVESPASVELGNILIWIDRGMQNRATA